MLFAEVLRGLIRKGQLSIVDANGECHTIGDPSSGPSVTIRLHDRALHRRLLFNPRLAVGEAYMDGTLTVEDGGIYDFLDLYGLNSGTGSISSLDGWLTKTRMLWRRIIQLNNESRSKKNVAHHYDLSGALYDLFLDTDRQYTCAYYPAGEETLEQAQHAKKAHIAAKLLLEPGQKVLDLGCGWGGLGLYFADVENVDVTGVTLSQEQVLIAQNRANSSKHSARVRFELKDYRDVTGQYDRISAIGLLEHVGTPQYRGFFQKIFDLLADDGVALVHTISHMDEPYPTNPWLQKYIFPGGYAPALSEILPAIERANLWVTDIEVLRLHYAKTLADWRERFVANWERAASLYDERFCRMWEFYLAACEMTFRRQGHTVVQIQLAKSLDAVPLTRNYIAEQERHYLDAEPSLKRFVQQLPPKNRKGDIHASEGFD